MSDLSALDTFVAAAFKTRYDIDGEVISRDLTKGLKLLDLREFGLLGSAVAFGTPEGWKIVMLPFDPKKPLMD